jgi:hypothetical protein
MGTSPVMFSGIRRRQLDDVKDDRLVAGRALFGDLATIELDELDELDHLVDTTISIGDVEISEIVMCAKCVGECKVF